MFIKNFRHRLRFSGIPLKSILIIPFFLQIFGTVTLVGYLSFRNGQDAVNNVASQLRLEISERVRARLINYLATPYLATQVIADDISSRRINLEAEDFSTLSPYLMERLQGFENLSFLKIGDSQGQFVGVGRLQNLGQLAYNLSFADLKTKGLYQNYKIDSNLNRKAFVGESFAYDARIRPWYLAGRRIGRPVWSEVYLTTDTPPTLSISNSHPLYDRDRNFLGIAGGDLFLGDISTFLRFLQVGKSGQAFVIDRSGLMVATSDTEQLYTITLTQQAELLPAIESKNSLTQATAKFLQAQFGGFENIYIAQSFAFNFNGEKQFVQIMPFQDQGGLDWLIVVAIPESDFMEQINANNRLTILLCLLALLLTSAIGLLTADWVARLLQRLITAARAMTKGELEQHVEVKEVREIRVLADAFNEMARQLQESFVALRTNQAALQKSKDDLEQRVAERTVELTQAMVNLQQAQTQLVQNEKMSSLGQLVAGVAHEINNPVNFIYGNVAYAQEHSDSLLRVLELYLQTYPEPSDEIVEVLTEVELDYVKVDLPKILISMKTGAERIREIVRSLRTFSRLDEAEMKEVDLHESIDSSLMILQSRIKANADRPEVIITKNYAQLPPVECYAGQLNQVFMNLFVNALDALEDRDKNLPTAAIEHPKEIIIQTTLLDNAYKEVEIRITDNAQGMPPEVIEKIFNPFYTTKVIGKGTGLGLAISYQIVVERHQGKLECISQLGQGTEFVITIPLKTSPSKLLA